MLPAYLAEMLRGFQASRIALTAVELNVFTAVGKGAAAEEVASRIGADSRATAILLDALAALGLLEKRGATYRNTPDTARYLDEASPENERLATLHTVHMWQTWSTLTECVRAGGSVTAREEKPAEKDWTEAFIAAMARNAAERAPRVAAAVGAERVRRMLDIGGGPGSYAIAFARANPRLRAVVLDKPEVLEIARRHIAAAGFEERITTQPGDLKRDRFGEGYDLALVSNICHMLSPEQNRDLLARAAAALVPGGRLVIHDFILDGDRTSPQAAAVFAVNMLVATAAGNSYTEQEYAAWLQAAGLGEVQRIEIDGPTDLMVARKTPPEGRDAEEKS